MHFSVLSRYFCVFSMCTFFVFSMCAGTFMFLVDTFVFLYLRAQSPKFLRLSHTNFAIIIEILES